eukprot:m.70926 g.70926  ORF g.70926 m.70926 type:complete len:312 (-) comp24287_c0_seq1:155-1090(-)
MHKECSNCGKRPMGLKVCGRCQQTRYCSVECQKIHWKKGGHKVACAQLQTVAIASRRHKGNPPRSSHEEELIARISSGASLATAKSSRTTTPTTSNSTNDPINPCPICLTNEDDDSDLAQCFNCGQLFCGECTDELNESQATCPTCRAPFDVSDKESFDRVHALVHVRSPGRHTPAAQYTLGTMYNNGRGVEENHTMAVKYYTLAADQGLAGAQFGLGFMYAKGQGVTQSTKLASKFFKLAAEQDHAVSLQMMPILFAVTKRVKLVGLKTEFLNGLMGTVTKALANWCAEVAFDDPSTATQSIPYLNLELV